MADLERIHDLLRPGGWLAICDATPFDGRFRLLNRPMRAIFVPTTRWVPDRDLPAAMRRVFGNVEVERFNGGSLFVARSERR